jgi:hypothetical protein
MRSLRRILEPIRKALKAAGGAWDWERGGEGIQLRFARGARNFRVAGFEGKALTTSEGVRSAAIALHVAAVDELARGGPSPVAPH